MKASLILVIALAGAVIAAPAEPLVVHEWGTFTSLQDEAGATLRGINTDDEPVPRFCHDLDTGLIVRSDELPPVLFKAVISCDPDVTMRLETPVVYFHLPRGASTPVTASVKVAFRGGWLTQFYPAAVTGGFLRAGGLTAATTGTLAWNDLKIGDQASGPETTERVWTAPRAVAADGITANDHESEKFLFYRGVGHLLCPLQVSRSTDGRLLEGRAQCQEDPVCRQPLDIRRLWLTSFRADGTCAFRALPALRLGSTAREAAAPALFSVPAQFDSRDYSAARLPLLRQEMHQALVEEGMFSDEADALLNTWELSYFKSPGLRLFFMVPRTWTDAHLPLEVSVPCEIKRAMVGRLELVTPEQRAILAQLAHAPVPTAPWAHYEVKDHKTVIQGAMPPAYRELGRFRNTLLLDEYAARPTKSLEAFIRVNRLERFPRAQAGSPQPNLETATGR